MVMEQNPPSSPASQPGGEETKVEPVTGACDPSRESQRARRTSQIKRACAKVPVKYVTYVCSHGGGAGEGVQAGGTHPTVL